MAALLDSLKDSWRKNAPELAALLNGALPRFVLERRPAERLPGVPVFCYHLTESEALDADLDFLARNGYRTIGSSELIEHLAGRHVLPDRAVMLTFDDGPRNFHDVAFPLLRRHAARAVAFIAPGLHAAEADPDHPDRPMTWKEIMAIHASGLVEFQSHTLESRFVPKWPAPAALSGCEPALEQRRRNAPLALRDDLAASQKAIESRLPGARVDQLCFPQYVGTAEAIDVARSLGFRGCYWGLLPGRPLNRAGDSPFHISRLSDEYLRRLPGSGRAGLSDLLRQRLHRSRTAAAWRRRYA
ncbi:MAG: polysaccharide deacetylase family protein [Gammaproteobacteria bacterium]|nr:polysaccharide deacetylase family protein [Gammaproteobacteria bacterium]